MRSLIHLTGSALLVTVLLAGQALADAPAVSFTKKPVATKSAEGLRIEFAVSSPTDVAVYVEDAAGKVVCHVVAGAIGDAKNPPTPLKAGLEQSILWDGKDDAGKIAGLGGQGSGIRDQESGIRDQGMIARRLADPSSLIPYPSSHPIPDPRTPTPAFKVRVAIGMKPQFDRFVMYNPDGIGRVSALAVGPAGNLYVFHMENTANDNMAGPKIKLFSRDGKAVKTLMPFPADISPDKLKAINVFKDADGSLIPHVYNWEHLSFYPDTIGGRGRDMPEAGELPAVDSKGRVYWMVHGPAICAIDADCGVPYDTFIGPKLLTDVKGLKMAGEGPWEYGFEKPSLAVSSDDKYVYFAGLAAAAGPLPCVYRVDATTRGPAEVFLGKPDQAGKEKDLLTAPRGLAVAKGMVYVADAGADRIAVFKEADRSFVGEIKVAGPQCVGVDPASGAIYVCTYPPALPKGAPEPKPDPTKPKGPQLVKFDGLENTKELYRLALPGSSVPGQTRIAVDASAAPVRIWVPEVMYAPWSLKCIEDAGDKFVDKGELRDAKTLSAEGPRDLTLDRDRGELYIKTNFGKMSRQKFWRLNEKTCEVLKEFDAAIVSSGIQMVPGTDGAMYTMCFDAGLFRMDREFKPLNFEGQKSNLIRSGGVMNFQQRNLALRPFAPVDELYVVVPPFSRLMLEEKASWEDGARKAREHLAGRFTSLNVLGQDGKTRRTAVWQCLDSAVPRVDRWGNIYVADSIKPADRLLPEFFDGKLPAPGQKGGSDLHWTSAMYGSIVKFPPTGGAFWFAQAKGKRALSCLGDPPADLLAKPKIPFRTEYDSGNNGPLTGEVQGAEWIRFGYSPYSIPGSGGACNCEGNGFDVDPFGRVFYPNMGQARVEVIDTNNNPIAMFGKYGNEDSLGSAGKDAKVAKPDIPLAWPVYVVASDTHAYVADTVNRRVVRVKLAYTAEESCAVK